VTSTRNLLVLLVGSVSRDLEEQRDRTLERPGGTVHYAGRALLRLGARVRVVTRVHPDDQSLLDPLRREGAEVHALESPRTTTYRNDYSGPVDLHELLAASDPISLRDVPVAWRDSDVVQLGPLHAHDIEPDFSELGDGLIGLDLQGLVRQAHPQGTRLEPNADLARFLAGVRVVQASESELSAALEGASIEQFVERHSIPEMIVTRGARGALVLCSGQRFDVPTRPVQGVHRVGSGDVFLASYLFFRASGRPPPDASVAAGEVCAVRIEKGEVPRGFHPGGGTP
jgi:sugar/nucleoside kinase (ribokinase family)